MSRYIALGLVTAAIISSFNHDPVGEVIKCLTCALLAYLVIEHTTEHV